MAEDYGIIVHINLLDTYKTLTSQMKIVQDWFTRNHQLNIGLTLSTDAIKGLQQIGQYAQSSSTQVAELGNSLSKLTTNFDKDGNPTTRINELKTGLAEITKVYESLNQETGKFEETGSQISTNYDKQRQAVDKLEASQLKLLDTLKKFEGVSELQPKLDNAINGVTGLNVNSTATEWQQVRSSINEVSDSYKNLAQEQKQIQQQTESYTQMFIKQDEIEKQQSQTLSNLTKEYNLLFQSIRDGVSSVKLTEEQMTLLQERLNLLQTGVGKDAFSQQAKDLQLYLNELKEATLAQEKFNTQLAQASMPEYQQATAKLQQMMGTGTNIGTADFISKGSTNQLIDGLEVLDGKVTKVAGDWIKVDQSVKQSDGTFKKVSASINTTSGEVDNLSVKTGQLINRELSFGEAMNIALTRIIEWQASTMLIFGSLRQFEQAFSFINETNKQLTTLQMEMTNTQLNFADLTKEANQYAIAMGSTTTNVIQAMQIFSNYNSTMSETMDRSKAAILLSNLSGKSVEESANAILAMENQFHYAASDSQKMVDILAATARTLQIDYPKAIQEVAGGIERVGSLANQAKVPLSSLASMIGTVAEQTRISGDTIGVAYKTIFSRISNVGDESDPNAFKGIEKSFNAIGVAIKSDSETIRPLNDVLSDLASKWSGLTDVQKNQIATDAAGIRQKNIFISTMDSWQKITKNATDALNSQGVASQKNEIYLQSLQAHVNQFIATWQQLYINLTKSDSLKGIVDLGTRLIGILSSLSEHFGTLPTLIFTVVGAVSTFNSKFREGIMSSIGTLKVFTKEIEVNGQTLKVLDTTQGKFGIGFSSGIKNSIKDLTETYQVLKMYNMEANNGVLVGSKFSLMFQALTNSAIGARLAIVATTIATAALQAVITMGISFAITGLVTVIGNWIESSKKAKEEQEHLNQALQNSRASYDALKADIEAGSNSKSGLQGDIDRLKELNKSYDDLIAKIKKANQAKTETNYVRGYGAVKIQTQSIYDPKTLDSGMKELATTLGIDIYQIKSWSEFLTVAKQKQDELNGVVNEATSKFNNYQQVITSHIHNMSDVLAEYKKTTDEIQKYNDILAKAHSGQELSGKDIADLIEKYPDLINAVRIHNGVLQLDTATVEELRLKMIQTKVDSYNSQIVQTQNVIAETSKRIITIDAEIQKYKDLQRIMATTMTQNEIANRISGEQIYKNSLQNQIDNGKQTVDALQKLIEITNSPSLGVPTKDTTSSSSSLREQVSIEDSLIRSYNTEANITAEKNKILTKQIAEAKNQKDYNEEIQKTNDLIKGQTLEVSQLQEANKNLQIESQKITSNSGFNTTGWLSGGEATLAFQEKYNSESTSTQKAMKATFDELQKLDKAMISNNTTIDTLTESTKALNQSMLQTQTDFANSMIDTLKKAIDEKKKIVVAGIDAEIQAEEKRHKQVTDNLDDESKKFEDAVNAKIRALDDQTNAEDYNAKLTKDQAEAQTIQNQINALMFDNSPETNSKRIDLSKQLADKQTAIDDEQRKHNIDLQKRNLQDQLTNYKNDVTAQKKAEDDKYQANKDLLAKQKKDQETYYTDLANDEKNFAQIREDIIKGSFSNIRGQLDEYKKYFMGINQDIAKSMGLSFQEIQNAASSLSPTVKVRSGSADENILKAQYGNSINYDTSTGKNQYVGADRIATNSSYQNYLSGYGLTAKDAGDLYNYKSTVPEVPVRSAFPKDAQMLQALYGDKINTVSSSNIPSELIGSDRFSTMTLYEDWIKRKYGISPINSNVDLAKFHDGGIVSGGIPNRLTDLANKLFNVKPGEQVIKSLIGELQIPQQNIMNNFIPNMQNLIGSFKPVNSMAGASIVVSPIINFSGSGNLTQGDLTKITSTIDTHIVNTMKKWGFK